jgi:integrase
LTARSRATTLDPQPDKNGKTEADRLYAVRDASNSKWLGAAVRIAVETGLRQAELSGSTFNHLHLDGLIRMSTHLARRMTVRGACR